MKLQGKVAVITGAASGIGRATAQAFAREGAKLVLADLDECGDVVAELKRDGATATAVQGDVSREADVDAIFAAADAAFGQVDVVVNAAGVDLTKKICDTSPEEWDRVLRVNLTGTFLSTRRAVQVMTRGGGGVIVNIASTAGIVGVVEGAAYAASKGGVVLLTKSVAIDHAADGIRANCICPGPVATPMIERIIAAGSDPEADRRSLIDRTLLKRLAEPGEIAQGILFLACDESSYMTGAELVVDAGWTAR